MNNEKFNELAKDLGKIDDKIRQDHFMKMWLGEDIDFALVQCATDDLQKLVQEIEWNLEYRNRK